MASTFQDRLVTELRLAGASTIDQANEVLQEFLPRFNRRFAVAAEQPETAYRPIPADLSLTETVSIRHARKMARDNTVHYQWRVLQLLPGAERRSYAGLQVEVLERCGGELIIRYQGKPSISRRGTRPPQHRGDEAPATSPLLRGQTNLTAKLAVTWMRPSGSSWRTWSPQWRGGPRPLPRGNPCATSSSASPCHPAGSMGGGPAGQKPGTVPAGHR